MSTLLRTILVSAGLLTSSAVIAAPITYFGEDLNPGGSLPVGGNAQTAQADFLSNLTGVGIEDFESVAQGTSLNPGFNVSFPGSSGSITGTLSAVGTSSPGGVCGSSGGTVGSIGCGFGRFATSGTQHLHTTSSAFELTFSSAISAFGFYGIDIGDINGNIELILSNGGGSVNLAVPHTNGSTANGNVLFFGFIDMIDTYTGIRFTNSGSGSDVFGFDDLIIGDIGQIASVPEPTPLALMSLALFGVLVSRRKNN